ncbi:oxoglutarate-dependent flavonoid 7-O-demethylase 1 isoform X3 [Cryptomeria japonica]|uniref:oxoglutarate-dependent flavonoid 7-O-demethylase 1 isoform X3 n=1 Tax=Cryptomeria japonica TaxID=3369 RepID=UPI0027DA69D9|nr:oxoglutarate-dependent flavonoid 7-O-demethylase 1 isoform X3 [Cryptomeria japonica]
MDALLKQLERLQRPIDMVQTFHDCQIREVPARYILPFDQRPSLALEAPQSIPVIDLAAHRSEIITQVAQAAQDWGFFQIINHGIDLALLERVKGVSQEFFDLPLEEKRRQCPVRPGTHLLEGYGRFYDISDDTVLDWVDALVHFISPSSVKAVEHWPKRPLTYRKTYEKYGEEVLNLTDKLLGFLSEGLGLDSDYVQTLIKEPLLQLRTNYYPPCPQPDLVNGLRPHSDGDVLTILLDDQVVGLQVRKGVEWFNVSPVPGSLVVNVGDFLEVDSELHTDSSSYQLIALRSWTLPRVDSKIQCKLNSYEGAEDNKKQYFQTTHKACETCR